MPEHADLPKNLRHEFDAIAEGHRAILDGRTIRVVSDTYPALFYRVRAVTSSGPIVFECQTYSRATNRPCDATHGQTVSTEPGVAPCKHAALAARRLEREGLARYDDGLWITADAVTAAVAEEARVDDPFASFPKF